MIPNGNHYVLLKFEPRSGSRTVPNYTDSWDTYQNGWTEESWRDVVLEYHHYSYSKTGLESIAKAVQHIEDDNKKCTNSFDRTTYAVLDVNGQLDIKPKREEVWSFTVDHK